MSSPGGTFGNADNLTEDLPAGAARVLAFSHRSSGVVLCIKNNASSRSGFCLQFIDVESVV